MLSINYPKLKSRWSKEKVSQTKSNKGFVVNDVTLQTMWMTTNDQLHSQLSKVKKMLSLGLTRRHFTLVTPVHENNYNVDFCL